MSRVLQGLEQVSDALSSQALEPDPDRTDWRDVEPQVTRVVELVETALLAPFDEAMATLYAPDDRHRFALDVCYVVAGVAVLLHASSLRDGSRLLQRARHLGTGIPELEASAMEPDAFALLTWARWRLKQSDRSGARQLLQQLKKSTDNPVYKNAAQDGLDLQPPLTKAPTVESVDSFGTAFYGKRAPQPDGTFIGTQYFIILFTPLWPIASYRARDNHNGTYTFYSREKLRPIHRLVQALVVLGGLGIIAAIGLGEYWDSDEYKSQEAYAEAKMLEESGDEEAAREAYEKLLDKYSGSAEDKVINGAAKALVRLYCRDVTDPVTAASVSQVSRVVKRFSALPDRARKGPASTALTRQLEAWATAMGKKTNRDTEAGLEVLLLAQQVARGADLKRVQSRRRDWMLARAARVAPLWPQRALATFLDFPEHPPALAGAARVLTGLVSHPFALLDAERLAKHWLRSVAKIPSHATLAKRLRTTLKAARTRTEEAQRRALLKKPQEKQLVTYLATHPKDQAVANALARLQRQRGDTKAALATLSQLGPTRYLTRQVRLTLAWSYVDLGWLTKASFLLEAHLAGRLGRFQKALRTYQHAASDYDKELVARVEAGKLPTEVKKRLSKLTEPEQKKITRAWMSKQYRENQQLAKLRAAYQLYSTVVSACLTLGRVKLRQASTVRGKKRQLLLNDAERLYLAIRYEAEGMSSYHLALGQVYYRLGKKTQGQREFMTLLSRSNLWSHLDVAKAYRQLGMIVRAREVATAVWQRKAPKKGQRSSAATLMAVMADHLDEEELWLKRGDLKSEYVQLRLAGLRAKRFLSQGQLTKADALFKKVELANAKGATHSSTSANNAAIACQKRYYCTGDRRHLERGYKYQEAARRLAPDNTVVVSNLAASAVHLALINTLGRLFPVHALRLDANESWSVINALASGPLRTRILKLLQTDPNMRRCLELTRQEQVLSPERLTGYRREATYLALLSSEAGLRRLNARLARLKKLQTDQDARYAADYVAGKHDKRSLAQLAQTIGQREKNAAATARKQKPTHAVALLLLGFSYQTRARVLVSVADAKRAGSAFDRAHRAWPAAGLQRMALYARLYGALFGLMKKIPSFKKRWFRDRREYRLAFFLHRLLADPKAAATVSAVAALPELRQMLVARLNRAKGRPTLLDWVVARVLRDPALMQQTRAVFRQPDTRLLKEIDVRLTPWNKSDQLAWRLFQKHK